MLHLNSITFFVERRKNWHFSKTISVVLNNFIYNKKPLSHQEKSFNLVVLLNQLSMGSPNLVFVSNLGFQHPNFLFTPVIYFAKKRPIFGHFC